nr:hypothetical protein [uncultured Campylobacter sp.]
MQMWTKVRSAGGLSVRQAKSEVRSQLCSQMRCDGVVSFLSLTRK